jgi:hypothetical protein
MSFGAELAQKWVQAAIAAIEVYDKPTFSYREEAFALFDEAAHARGIAEKLPARIMWASSRQF